MARPPGVVERERGLICSVFWGIWPGPGQSAGLAWSPMEVTREGKVKPPPTYSSEALPLLPTTGICFPRDSQPCPAPTWPVPFYHF